MVFVPDYSSGLAALGQGVGAGAKALTDAWDYNQKRSVLSALGTQLQAGDYAGAAKSALESGDVTTGLSILKLGQAKDWAKANAGLLTDDPTQQPSAASTSGISAAPVGGFDNAVSRTLGFEGGLNPSDTNGTPSKFGINAAANPDVDQSSLTPNGAKAIYKQRYWDAIGGDDLAKTNPALAHVAFDTAALAGPAKAQELVQASGGDPMKYLALRDNFTGRLVQSDPAKYGSYAQSWANRSAALRSDIVGASRNTAPDDTTDSAPAISSTDADSPKLVILRKQQAGLTAALASAPDEGTRAAITQKLSQVGQQIKDAKPDKDSYSFHTLPDGNMVAINKADPTKVTPINTGARPKSQVEVNDRTAIADQMNLQGDERKQFVLNGKIPDSTHVLKPGDVLAGPQGQSLAQNNSAKGLDDQSANFLAERVLAGDAKALTGLGRGAQGSDNLTKINALIAQKAAERGIDASDILHNIAVAQGMGAQERTLGTQTGKMASASIEAEGAINLLRQASADVSRTSFMPINQALQAYRTKTGDPAASKFGAAIQATVNTYNRAISPTGVGTVSGAEHAYQMLNGAQSHPQLMAVLDQMQSEIDMAHKSPGQASKMLDDQRRERKGVTTGGVVPPQAQNPSAIGEGSTATGPNGQKIILRNGAWVPLQ